MKIEKIDNNIVLTVEVDINSLIATDLRNQKLEVIRNSITELNHLMYLIDKDLDSAKIDAEIALKKAELDELALKQKEIINIMSELSEIKI